MATSKVIRPQNLNNVFQQVAEQAAMKTPELSHNQQVSNYVRAGGHRTCTCTTRAGIVHHGNVKSQFLFEAIDSSTLDIELLPQLVIGIT